MTPEELERCERELVPLPVREGAPVAAREEARAFNAEVADVREELLRPARELLAQGAMGEELADCLSRAVAEVEFWRRVLVRMYPEHLGGAAAPAEHLLQYLRS